MQQAQINNLQTLAEDIPIAANTMRRALYPSSLTVSADYSAIIITQCRNIIISSRNSSQWTRASFHRYNASIHLIALIWIFTASHTNYILISPSMMLRVYFYLNTNQMTHYLASCCTLHQIFSKQYIKITMAKCCRTWQVHLKGQGLAGLSGEDVQQRLKWTVSRTNPHSCD